ncbi:MAG TPA: putative cytokinetic ring protein SteA [Bacillota bacterium]|nr:putative cytokinetic ring protein SteA [Bacillota bacterium]
MEFSGIAKGDLRTKNLIKRLRPGEIAIIAHQDLDELAAQSLVRCKPLAVINEQSFISGSYPNLGPQVLLQAEIPMLETEPGLLGKVAEGEKISLTQDGEILGSAGRLGRYRVLEREQALGKMQATSTRMSIILEDFVQNTLEYAGSESKSILRDLELPPVSTRFKGRHTLIVVRGRDYREDLQAIRSYVREVRPVLVGVDGGADALLEFGLKPELIVGDMDSISDQALACGAEIVVHAYSDGRAPGLQRVEAMGLPCYTLAAPGTSEDVAMLLAWQLGTELIVAVGTHSHMIDFLEKGRKGMASTFLVRLKVGPLLVDAKGVSKLYGEKVGLRHLAQMVGAALVPFSLIIWFAPTTRHLLKLMYLRLKIFWGP